jgi:hypothetical protein
LLLIIEYHSSYCVLLGLTAATFATTDSALTALTTSFCVDFLGMDKKVRIKSAIQMKKLKNATFGTSWFFVFNVFGNYHF